MQIIFVASNKEKKEKKNDQEKVYGWKLTGAMQRCKEQ